MGPAITSRDDERITVTGTDSGRNGDQMAILRNMSTHSVAQARNHLSELIDRALEGEGVVITRHGRPVVELRPVGEAIAPVSPGDLDWLAARRVGRAVARSDAGELLSGLRDEGER
jgi:prevent-host-death family protein